MKYSDLKEWQKSHKVKALKGRYITLNQIQPLLESLPSLFEVTTLGYSVENRPIAQVRFGNGPIKVLGWSQMHGNESTTTKALFDLFKWFSLLKDTTQVKHLLETCTFIMVPMLNPDGSQAYTRVNANQVDLNRDAQERTQPESVILRKLYKSFNPDICLNLHGQRTIFGVGEPPKSAIVSFLSPSQDELRTVTRSRKAGMAIISELNTMLQQFIPGSVGRYDDGFNLNCVGDTLQQLNIPTILFEAGHYPGDYDREETRTLMFLSLICVFESVLLIKSEENASSNPYFSIPENKKCFFDHIIRSIELPDLGVVDLAIQYEETLVKNRLHFIPKISQISDLENYKGHNEIDFKSKTPDVTVDFKWKEGVTIDKLQGNGILPTTFSLKS